MSLYSYGSGKSKIGSSNFNMSFQNLYTANFGSLNPAACYEVLAGDKWKIAQNSLTKVAPMPAPAYSRIKQNFYSFFVANQTIWRHWNDFITNGSAYLDTYGNNQTNQDITNQWKQPSVFANDLQLIGKIGSGWAIPVFRLDESFLALFKQKLGMESGTSYSFSISVPYEQFSDGVNSLSGEGTWNLLRVLGKFQLPEFFDRIPYIHPVWNYQLTSPDSNNNSHLSFRLDYFTFGCDLQTAYLFWRWLNSTSDYINPQVTDTVNETITDGVNGYKSENLVNTFFSCVIRNFCDMYTDDCRVDYAPFRHEKYCFMDSETGNTLNGFAFYRNMVNFQHFEYDSTFYHNGSDSSDTYYVHWYYDRAGFYSRSFGIVYNDPAHAGGIHGYIINGCIFWNSTDNYLIDDIPYIFGNNFDYMSYFCGESFVYDNSSAFSLSGPNLLHIPFLGDDLNALNSTTSSSFSSFFLSPFYQSVNSLSNSFSFDSYYIGSHLNACDVWFPIYCRANDIGNCFYQIPVTTLCSLESFSLGYDAFSFMIYQCKQAVKLLDYFNIPLEGLICRSWEDYAGELINCLPFFAYSKVYNTYFRNKVTTASELDFSYSNGVAFCDYVRQRYLNILKNLNVPMSEQVKQLLSDEKLNSWVIPMCTAPKSGLTNYTVEFANSPYFVNYVQNEFHYFNTQTYFDLFSLLTGFQLTSVMIDKIIKFAVKKTISGSVYLQLSGLLLENVYLPSYYNGLLHLKYQNFTKDYFSSAVTDPMHGANQVNVGSTITELREGVIEQGFWESTAFRRSIKSFFEGMFGTTPTHGDEIDPIPLGVDHLPVNIGEVIQTSETTSSSPQGSRSGLAAAHGKGGLCKHYFNEQGYIIILSSITLEQQYFQGLEKMWTPLNSFLDYPFVQFAGVGNESIPLRELKFVTTGKYNDVPNNRFSDVGLYRPEGSKVLYDGQTSPLFIEHINRAGGIVQNVHVVSNTTAPYGTSRTEKGFNEIFGFVPRYSSYKFKLDQVHGAFRNQMDYWQTFRKFFKDPMLVHEFVNWEFVADDGELNRLFAVQDDNVSDKFYVDCYINALVTRKLPYVCRPKTGL